MKDKLLIIEKWLSSIIIFLCGAAITSGILLVFTITIARYAFGISWEWAEELSRYCILLAALVGSGPMVFNGTHISMDLLVNKLKNKTLIYAQQMFSAVCILALSILMTSWSVRLVSVTRMRSYSLIFQMKMVYAMIPFSMAVMALYAVLKILVLTVVYSETMRGEVK